MVAGLMGWVGLVGEEGWRKGPWTPEEDKLLSQYVTLHGEGRWSYVSRSAGLNRSGKSCRLRWVNYLRPGLKRGQITPQEEAIIIELHSLWGNKWSTIARYLPGRTDNEIKNYWRTHFKKKVKSSKKSSDRRKAYIAKIKPLATPQQHQEFESIKENIIPTTQPNNNIYTNNHNQEPILIDPIITTTVEDENIIVPTPSTTWMDDNLFWTGLCNFGDQLMTTTMTPQQDQLCGKMALTLQNQATNNFTPSNNNIIRANSGLFWGEYLNNIFSDQGFSF